MAFVQRMLFNLTIPLHQRQNALSRAQSDPGIPDPTHSTSPFWLKQPHPQLATIQSCVLSPYADIVIIGSGITSASITTSLLQSSYTENNHSVCPKITILEARDICSGATGRNGGHILETAEEFADLVQAIGIESAKKVTRFRMSHLNELLQVAEDFDLTEEAQVRRVNFLSAYFDESRWREAVESITMFKEAMPSESVEWKIIEQHQIPKEYSLSHAVGIITGPAGALWPYKFVTGLFSRLLSRHPNQLTIETNTPATSIHRLGHNNTTPDTTLYKVTTPRGPIFCKHIIHSTNAHITHLIPTLRGLIYPVRGHMSAQTPGTHFSQHPKSQFSWLFNYKTGFDYLTQLPNDKSSSNEMMLGGGFAQSEYGGITDLGVPSDSEINASVENHLTTSLDRAFDCYSHDDEENKLSKSTRPVMKSLWTGSMGFSADGFPWVGGLPASYGRDVSPHDNNHSDPTPTHHRETSEQRHGDGSGEWICAGFSGEGMVHAWRCGNALASMLVRGEGIYGSEGDDGLDWFPEQMLITEERIRRVRLPEKDDLNIEDVGLDVCGEYADDTMGAPVRVSALP